MHNIRFSPLRHGPQRTRQRGVTLFVVIVFVMLAMLLALWASRTSLFNEMVVGNDADYQRAFEAAQALLQDAELDIRGENPDGSPCMSILAATCRDRDGSAYKIPVDAQEVTPLLAELDTKATKCFSGLCVKRAGRQDFWNYRDASMTLTPTAGTGEISLATMTAEGARYGQYTGALKGDPSDPLKTSSPYLYWDATTPANQGGWYWIEIMPYDESSKNSGLIVGATGTANNNLLALNLKPNVAYRITALAYGRKRNAVGDPVTMAVLQQSYVRQVLKD